MTAIGITGPRSLTPTQTQQVRTDLAGLRADEWHIGDAAGVDALAWATATGERHRYEPRPGVHPRAALAERSTRMVKALAATGGTLHAWPNKPAPATLKPGRSWGKASGSGTWGTIALAVGLGVPVELHLLGEFELPTWLEVKQACLF